MKILRFLLFCPLLLAASCGEKHEGADINRGVDITVLESLTDYTVPVKEGYTTVVTLDNEVLAVTRSPITILVPKSATRASQVEVSYSKEDIFGEFGSSVWWQYLSFEDTHNGDYDYNDVVIHCRVKSDVPWNYDGTQFCQHVVSVQPVALGGTRNLKLGILYQDDAGAVQEKILCEDIRRDIFQGNPLFPINTDPKAGEAKNKKVTNYLTDFLTVRTHNSTFPVVWFLETGAERLYAATTNFGANQTLNMISEDGLPYGISLTKKWCYPVERCHIRNAYPNFDKWLHDGNENTLLSGVKSSNTYPATIPHGSDGDLWDWKPTPAQQ